MDNSTQKVSEAPVTGEVRLEMRTALRPAVFLMVNSLETGGSERQFAALAHSLDRSQFSLELGCVMEKGAFLEGLGEISRFPLRGSLYSITSCRSRFQLGRYLRQRRVAVAHAFDFYTNLVLIPVAWMARVPVVIGSQRQIGDLLTPAQSRVQRMTFALCDKVVCNSQAAAERLHQEGIPQSKLAVIRNGLPPSAFAQSSPALPPVPGLLRVGMIARMNHRAKNHLLFLTAAARVAARFPQVEFILVGDGPLRVELEEHARTLGLSRVQFIGDRRDIPAVLASLDITVLPSSSESLSNSILESMAAGVPVIANRVGGNPELLGEDRGLLVPPNDDDALAAGIESLLRDEAQRVRLAHRARSYAQANFTIENMHKQHEELYLDLLQRKRWRPGTRSPAASAASTACYD